MSNEYTLGDIVETKKKHPCGSAKWKIVRIGADVKIKCCGCDHLVMVPRIKFNKMIKKIIPQAE